MPEEAAAATLWTELAATPLSVLLRESAWAYPALETAHIVGIALVFGSILAFDLRVLGRQPSLPLDTLAGHLLPWVWTGFVVNATSGGLLFVSDPVEFAANPALVAKLGLIAVAGLNALVFQWRYAPTVAAWNQDAPAPAGARVLAILSIGLWLAVIVAGRMMAYVA